MKIDSTQITAVILAGGKGRRLGGQDKGLIEFQGKQLIQYALDNITPQVSNILVNANRNQKEYKAFGFPVISDDLSDFQGPLAGFATAMKQSKTDFIVTMPCDAPELPEDYVVRLSNHSNNQNTIVVAHDGERLQPVHALIPVVLLDSLLAFLESGERKIDHWYVQNSMITADFSDVPEMFFNINTEEQRMSKNQNA